MTRKLKDALKKQKKATRRHVQPIYGMLGIPINGARTVEVANRNSYVYVRLRNNQSEVIQAFNNKVSPAYNLPVIVERQGNRYTVISVDTERYDNNWNSFAPYLPRHGNTHSFDLESGGAGDIVWVHSRQFMPMLAFPSGSTGGSNVVVASYTLKNDDNTWKYVGNTGTPNITQYNPTSPTGAVMVLVYLDIASGNPMLIAGTGTVFSSTLTGTNQIVPYIPSLVNPVTQIPISAIRLVTGTSQISWDNIYDVRQFLHGVPTGSGGGGSTGTTIAIWDEGILQGSVTTMNFVGTTIDASVSGSVARVFVTGSVGSSFTGLSGSVALLDANGLLTSEPWLKWGTISGDGYLEWGANVVKEANAGRIGYQLFDAYFDIIGAGTSVGSRSVQVYDVLRVSNQIISPGYNVSTLFNVILGTDGSGNVESKEAQLNSGTYGRQNAGWTEVIPADGWQFVQEVWTRTGDYTFTVSGDLTARYRKGTKVKYNDPALEYGVVGSSSHSAGTTTVTLITNSDYAMAAATITGRYISYIENPEGWPHFFNVTIGYTGFSANPTTLVSKYRIIGNSVNYIYVQNALGTSNATSFSITNLPVAAATALTLMPILAFAANNSANITNPIRVDISGTTIAFYTDVNGSGWTASGTKGVYALDFWYTF